MIYWRLSSFYTFYFALVGCYMPFWGLYLKDRGLSVLVISQLMALSSGMRMLSPNMWGYLADRFSRRIVIIRWGAFGAFAACISILFPLKLFGIFLTVASLSFFWSAILPQFEVITLKHLAHTSHNYSHIRLWGSLGFVLSVLGGGFLFDVIPIAYVPYYMLVCLVGILLSSCWVPEPHATVAPHQQMRELWQQLKQPGMLLFFLVCFLMQLGHGPYYALFSLYLQQMHYSHTAIGGLWALGVVAEILLFLLIPQLFHRRHLITWMLIATGLAVVRWGLLAFAVHSIVGLLIAQSLHAATFALFHLVCVYWVHQYFSLAQQGQGQALYNSIGYGVGGCLGSLGGGLLWKYISPNSVFIASAVACLLACAVIVLGLRKCLPKAILPSGIEQVATVA